MEKAELALAEWSRLLNELKRDFASALSLKNSQADLQGFNEKLREEKAKLSILESTVSAASARVKDIRDSSTKWTAERIEVDKRLAMIGAAILSLKSRRGDTFEEVKLAALNALDLEEMYERWFTEFLAALKNAGGITILTDIDGRFRFENVFWSRPLLYAVSDERTFYDSSAPRALSVRIPPSLWIASIDVTKTTLVDLGQSSVVQAPKTSIPELFKRLDIVVGTR